MLMAVDTGNTQTVLGLFDGDELKVQIRTAAEIFHYTVCDVVASARLGVESS